MALAGQNNLQSTQRGSVTRGLAGRLRHRRNKIIASPSFQYWAARLPIVRNISAGKARKLFDLAAGFVYSQILFALVDAGIFGILEAGPRSTTDIAGIADLPTDGAERLLRASAEIDLLTEIDGLWHLTDLGAVVAANAGIRAMVRHHAMLYDDLSDPLSLLRKQKSHTKINTFWKYAATDSPEEVADEEAAAYSALMSASQDLVIEEILSAYDFSGHRCLLDVGGGEGRFLRAVKDGHPKLQLQLFDLPAVARRARNALEQTTDRDQVDVHSGDFFRDPLPTGADLVSLVRILCDHDDGPALKLLTNIRSAMDPGAKILIAEPMGGRDGRAGGAAAYFGFYFLAMQSGRSRRPADIRRLLEQAGFSGIRQIRTRQPLMAGLMVAHN